VDDLDYAHSLADDAVALTMQRYRALDLVVETKADLTPVTDADSRVEGALRERIASERGGEAVAGEEFGVEEAEVRWWLDPIDGTKQYARGLPIWATLIALERSGQIAVGVVSAPALGHRWWAERGAGAFAAGLIGGLAAGAIVGSAVANSRPAYVVGPGPGYVVYPGYAAALPGPSCYWTRMPVYDAYGNVVGWRGRPVAVCP